MADLSKSEPCHLLQTSSPELPCDTQAYWKLFASRNDSPGGTLPLGSLLLSANANSAATVDQILKHGFVPSGRNLDPWPLSLPLDWDADPYDDRNWQFQLHAWRMIDPMLVAWGETADQAYLQQTWQFMADWHDYHLGQSSAYQWYDMAMGLRATKLAFIIEHVTAGTLDLDSVDRRKLLNLAYVHASNLTDIDQLGSGNHGFFQLHGLMALCKTVPLVATCEGYEGYVETNLEDLLGRQFSSEGIHLEAAPEYHYFVYRTVERIAASGWYADFEVINDLMGDIATNQALMVHPDRTTVTVGDSEPKKLNIAFPDGLEQCQEHFRNNKDCYFSEAFYEAGYAMIRSDWAVPPDEASMLFFMGMFHNSGHKLPDDLSFEWFDQGRRILTNAGKYSYDVDDFRSYVASTRAHNAVEIGNSSYSSWDWFAYGSALKNVSRERKVFRIEGEVVHRKLFTTHQRVLYQSPGEWLAVVDNLTSWWRDDFTQWFHFAPDVLVGARDGCCLTAKGGNDFELFIRHIPDNSDYRLVRGQLEPDIQGWVTASYGQMEERDSLAFPDHDQDGQLVTIFAFSEEWLAEAENYVSDQGLITR